MKEKLSDLLWHGFCLVDDFFDKLLNPNMSETELRELYDDSRVSHVDVLGYSSLAVLVDEGLERMIDDTGYSSRLTWKPGLGACRVYYNSESVESPAK